MDSQDYFRRAEKANKSYRMAVIVILLITVVALFMAIALLFKINQDNHRIGVQNQQTINSNFDGYVKCLVDSSYSKPPATTLTEVNAELDRCAQSSTTPLKGN